MAWSTPITWATNQLVTAANLNEQLRDNTNFLFNGKYVYTYRASGAPAYSTTSTVMTPMDATNLARYNVQITSGRVWLGVFGSFYADVATNRGLALDFEVDGVDQGGGNLLIDYALSTFGRPGSLAHIVTGLSNGLHTFKLKWRATYLYAYCQTVNFLIMEL